MHVPAFPRLARLSILVRLVDTIVSAESHLSNFGLRAWACGNSSRTGASRLGDSSSSSWASIERGQMSGHGRDAFQPGLKSQLHTKGSFGTKAVPCLFFGERFKASA